MGKLEHDVQLIRARSLRLGLEALAVNPSFEPIGTHNALHTDTATEREIEQSKAISLKRIANALDALTDIAPALRSLAQKEQE